MKAKTKRIIRKWYLLSIICRSDREINRIYRQHDIARRKRITDFFAGRPLKQSWGIIHWL